MVINTAKSSAPSYAFISAAVLALRMSPPTWRVIFPFTNTPHHSNSPKAIRDHVDDEDKRSERIVHPLGGVQQTTFINESGLYSLILSSKLPKAREFKRWVTAEVLPQIRRTGGYIVHYHLPIYNVPFVRIILLQKEMQPTFGLLPHHHSETPCV